MLARTLEQADWPASAVPIIYLPGVSRADLRAIETCPRALQPLAELQYRGLFWSQLNGRDWTLNAFLSSSRGGLNLDLSADQGTQHAMHRALDVLVDTPVDALKGRRLEASDFDALLSADPVRDLLTWMNNPEGTAEEWQGARWDAFRSRCKADWKLDPKTDGVAGRRGAHQRGAPGVGCGLGAVSVWLEVLSEGDRAAPIGVSAGASGPVHRSQPLPQGQR